VAVVVLIALNVWVILPAARGERIARGIAEGRASLKQGDAREAEILLRAVLDLHAESTEALDLLVLALDAQGRHDDAVEAARRTVDLDENRPVSQLFLASHCLSVDEYIEARERATIALLAMPGRAHYVLGCIDQALGDVDGAIEHLKMAREQDAQAIDPLLRLADLYLSHPRGSRIREAEAAYNQAKLRCDSLLDTDENNISVLQKIARAEVGLGGHVAAVGHLRAAVRLCDEREWDSLPFRLAIIRIYADHLKDLGEAVNEAETLTASFPNSGEAWLLLARARMLNGEEIRAIETLERGLAKCERMDGIPLRVALIEHLVASNRLDEARQKAATAAAVTESAPVVCVARSAVLLKLASKEDDPKEREKLRGLAAESYAAAIEKAPQNLLLRRQLVGIILPTMLARGEPDRPVIVDTPLEQQALDSIDQMLALRPEDPEASYWRGRFRLRAATDEAGYDEAMNDLGVAAQGFRSNVDVLRWLGVACLRADEPAAAAKAFDWAVTAFGSRTDPAGARLYVLLARTWLITHPDGTLKTCDEALRRWPEGNEVHALLLLKTRALLRTRHGIRALETARTLHALDSANHEALIELGRALEMNDEFEEAESMFFQAVARKPGTTTRTALARFLHARGKLDVVKQQYEALLADGKDRVETLIAYGTFLRSVNERAQAIEILEEACRLGPSTILPRVHLADALIVGGNEEEVAKATAIIRKLKDEAPSHPDVLALDARMVLRGGDAEGALALLDRVLAERPRDASALYYKGRALFALGRAQEARGLLEKALAFAPSLTAAKMLLARIELSEGYRLYREHRTEAARAPFERALDLNPKLGVARVLLADTYFDLGMRDLTREEIKSFLTALPGEEVEKSTADRAAAVFLLGFVSCQEAKLEDGTYDQKKLDEAVSAFRHVTEIEPKNWSAHFQLGLVYEQKGATEMALRSLDVARQLAPGTPAVAFAMVRAHLDRDEKEAACELLISESREHPGAAGYPHLLGDLFRRLGDNEQALLAYAEARRREPRDVGAVLTPARMLSRKGSRDEARILVEGWIPRAGDAAAPLHRWLGEDAFQRGKFEVAVEHLHKALDAGESDPEAAVRLGQAIEKLGRRREAIVSYETAVRMGIDSVLVFGHLADLLLQEGRFDRAIPHYERVLDAKPGDLATMNNLALALAEHEFDLDRARKYAEAVLEKRPRDPAVMDTLGWVLLQKGEPQRALALFNEARRRAPADATITFHRAVALMRTGEVEKGRKELSMLMMSPRTPDDLRARIRHHLKDL
jgi:tetratricopeptide (TPR) repeat protein